MTDWWEQPYKGGPMVDVPGFPRAMYPPDAAPEYDPSEDGPDVIAYKRTVSRLGRWPWQTFDDAYSNGFSHGKPGGNVKDSGVAGVQRQAKIQPTGFIGLHTFNLLRSARVPDGLPHAGDMAMDATAQSLLVDAWHKFNGKPPSYEGSSGYYRLQQAKFYIGVKENPAGSNQTEFGRWYGMDGQPWCAMFATFCDQAHSERPSASLARGERYAYVPYIVADARHDAHGLSVTHDPYPGDLVCYDWSLDGVWDHVGIFEGWASDSGSSFTAIEGNTSIESNSNGGQVMRRTRELGPSVLFVHVAEHWE